MFVLEKLRVNRQGKTVLQAEDFCFGPNELVAVVGPNGAGKSTLLQTLSGDLPAHSGRISLNGRSLPDWKLDSLARRRAVFTQNDTLSFPFTVAEVVMLGRMPQQHHSTTLDQQVVTTVLNMTDTRHYSARRYTELSGGERARVRLAGALAQIWPATDAIAQQRYLLLDEPLAALDLHYQYHMLEMLKSQICPQLGVLIVMHDLGLAARYADRVVLIDAGQVVAEGPPQQVLTSKRLSHHYRLPMQVLNLPDLDYPLITAAPHPRAAA